MKSYSCAGLGGKNVHRLNCSAALENKGSEGCLRGPCPVAANTTSSSPSSKPLSALPCGVEGDAKKGNARRSKAAQRGSTTKRSASPVRRVAVLGQASTGVTVIKPWRQLTKDERLKEATIFAQAKGGKALTINLSVNRAIGTETSEDPIRNLSKRFNEALNRHGLGDLPYSLWLEVTKESRPHLHGVLIPGDHDIAKIKQALSEAGGKIKGHAKARQIALRRIDNADGWFGYGCKDRRRTARKLDTERLTVTSRTMTRAVKEAYEARRCEHRAANFPRAVAQPAARKV